MSDAIDGMSWRSLVARRSRNKVVLYRCRLFTLSRSARTCATLTVNVTFLRLGGPGLLQTSRLADVRLSLFQRQLDAKVAKIAHSSTRGGAIGNLSEIVVFPRGSDFPGIVPATLRTLVPESSRTPARVD